jgi:hypothetical protein
VSKVFDNIQNLRIDWDNLDKAEFISHNANDFIRNLLIEDPSKRFNHSKLHYIKMHPFFNGIEWSSIRNTTNVYLKKYVVNKMKNDLKPENLTNNTVLITKETVNNEVERGVNSDYYAKKIENLYEKNITEIKNDISKKILEIDIDSAATEFTDFV